eukprot:571224-Amphidinium_carterae.1
MQNHVFGWHTPQDADGGAQVAPHELCTKLMDAAVSRGAEIRTHDDIPSSVPYCRCQRRLDVLALSTPQQHL